MYLIPELRGAACHFALSGFAFSSFQNENRNHEGFSRAVISSFSPTLSPEAPQLVNPGAAGPRETSGAGYFLEQHCRHGRKPEELNGPGSQESPDGLNVGQTPSSINFSYYTQLCCLLIPLFTVIGFSHVGFSSNSARENSIITTQAAVYEGLSAGTRPCQVAQWHPLGPMRRHCH